MLNYEDYENLSSVSSKNTEDKKTDSLTMDSDYTYLRNKLTGLKSAIVELDNMKHPLTNKIKTGLMASVVETEAKLNEINSFVKISQSVCSLFAKSNTSGKKSTTNNAIANTYSSETDDDAPKFSSR